MKRKLLFRTLGVLLLFVILLFAGTTLYINSQGIAAYPDVSVPELTVEPTADLLAHGKKLVYLNCQGCHLHRGKFEGQFLDDRGAEPLGVIYTSNITQHPEYGIGSYTDGELYRLLRTGVKKNGQLSIPVMPRWAAASEEDIHAMIAFLRSDDPTVQPSEVQQPAYEPTMLAKALYSFAWKPLEYQEQYPEEPSIATDPVAHGAYQINNRYLCYYCHSAGPESADPLVAENTPDYLKGGYTFRLADYDIEVPSLLLDGNSNISQWTEDQFVGAMIYGQRPNKGAYKLPMHPYHLIDTTEAKAIYQYLNAFSEQSSAVQQGRVR